MNDILDKYPNTKVYSPSKSIKSTTDEIKNDMKIKTKINSFHIIETPGHTLDHIILYDKENDYLFCGDTLFRFGCGRIFEGSLDQMYDTLQKINKLPDETTVFCGHEYTINNIKFLESIFVNSENLLTARNNVNDEIHKNGRSIPFNLGEDHDPDMFQSAVAFGASMVYDSWFFAMTKGIGLVPALAGATEASVTLLNPYTASNTINISNIHTFTGSVLTTGYITSSKQITDL